MSDERALVAAIGRLAAALPDGALDSLVAALRRHVGLGALTGVVANAEFAGQVRTLADLLDHPDAPASAAVALALECARERQRAAASQTISIVWTGPATAAVPVRHTEQALLELIDGACETLIVVSFALYRVDAIAAAAVRALDRGVQVTFVLEPRRGDRPAEDGYADRALGRALTRRARIVSWADDRRPRSANGDVGLVHAKCAIADGRRALVSSANLTEYALTLNMELGLLLTAGQVPARLQAHVESLIVNGDLAPLAPYRRKP